MGLAEKFRKSAYECFRWAQDARTPQDNAMWLGMAQFWLQLAQHAEDRDRKPDRGAEPSAALNNPGTADPDGDGDGDAHA